MTDVWADFRQKMPVAKQWAYLDHAAVAPIPAAAQAAVHQWAQEAVELGGASAWPRWNRRLEDARGLAALLIGAETDEIALVHSTTEGVNLVAEGYPWSAGDNVVTLADEFPTNLYPWMNLAGRGVETRQVATDGGRVDLDRLTAACDSRTRIVAISWVGFGLGWRNDLDRVAELAHARGALFFLDAIQGLGVFPLDVRRTPVDFLAADGHKWLLGPEGAGVFYMRKEHLDRLRPLGIGWNSVVRSHDFDRIELNLKNSAARYEGGTANSVGFISLAESLQLLLDYGADAISERVLFLTDLACRRLREIGATIASPREDRAHCSGIVLFELPGQDQRALRKACLERKVALSFRSGRLRISPHAYVNEDDIERLIEALLAGKP